MTKELIYDEQISPLMSQIIAICREHKIANLCAFSLEDEDGEKLSCTTAMLTDAFDPPKEYQQALDFIRPRQQSPMTITVSNEAGEVKEIHAIV